MKASAILDQCIFIDVEIEDINCVEILGIRLTVYYLSFFIIFRHFRETTKSHSGFVAESSP
jgi:hypothetical protein